MTDLVKRLQSTAKEFGSRVAEDREYYTLTWTELHRLTQGCALAADALTEQREVIERLRAEVCEANRRASAASEERALLVKLEEAAKHHLNHEARGGRELRYALAALAKRREELAPATESRREEQRG